MSDKKRNVPVLRFNGFSDAWEQRKLGDYAEILTGGTPKTSISEYWKPRKIPWMSSGEVNKRRLDGTDNMISEEGLNNSSARWIKPYSVLIALAGQGKTRGTVAVNNIRLTTNQSIAAIVPKDNLHYEFVYQNLIKRYDELRMVSSGDGTRGGLNKQIVSDIVIPSPSKEEQFKIGAFFKHLDNIIALHQRKLDTLQQMKKGFLQQLFLENGEKLPRVRFADFEGEWEQRKLGEISDKVVEKNKESIIIETLTNSAEYGVIGQREFFNKNISNERNLTEYYIVRENDFVYNPRISNFAPVGPIKRNKLGRIGVISPLYYVFRIHDVEERFLEYYFDATGWHKFMLLNGDSGARADRFAIKDSVLKEMPIPYPTLNEQKKISDFLDGISNTTVLYKNKLDKLIILKKTYLKNMFI
ncbi:restriction endonuclease subunit S [Listeria booriae]|uniref:restriction endonuclease subunit S n=1 Tax=Listeria booriae TaxID=1552123 RepID=UPI00162368E4|nr:restriction endonuclease subunit S [Listeria booriae]MBC2099444.1 restriction endonuclease subunit S [Listeria booriae]